MEHVALITGGAGFIGSHLADKLLADGWQVIAFDNLSIGRLENIAHLKAHPRFSVMLGDIADLDVLERIVKDFGVEVIFHMAAIHYIPYCNQHPYQAIRINVLGTQAVVDSAVAGQVRKIVFTSTSDVYAVRDGPHVEEDAVEPYTVYGASKASSERLLKVAVSQHHGLSVAVARLFNVYGPRETNPHVLPEILSQLKDSDGHTVHLGNTWPKRDFIYVDDVTDALVKMAALGVPFDVFNIGSGKALSVEQVVRVFSEVLGREIRVETDPARVRSTERSSLSTNIEKAERALGWRPRWDFEAGLKCWLKLEGLIPGS